MAFQRGDVVLIPFPFTDLSASKTRPTVVVSGDAYHNIRSELLLAYVSSQVSKANPLLDHVLVDWESASLLKPSFVRPKLAAIEPGLIVHTVGRLSAYDMLETDRRLLRAMDLADIDSLSSTPVLASATGIVVAADRLTVDFADGRSISVPIGWYPRLSHGTPEECANYQISSTGYGIHWPDLDEDIGVEGIMLGKKSMEGPKSFERWLVSRQE